MDTKKILTVIRNFDDAVAERTAYFVPNEIMSSLLECLLYDEDFLISDTAKAILDWYEKLPEHTQSAIAVETMALVKTIYNTQD